MGLSKGIDMYYYLGSNPYSVKFAINPPHKNIKFVYNGKAIETMNHEHHEVDYWDDTNTQGMGEFEWMAYKNDNVIFQRYAEISALTGNMGDSNLGDMLDTPSVISDGYAVSYGFYDAGPGWGSITNRDQSYVYVTSDHSNWMGDLAAEDSAIAHAPFSGFVLPGAHDAGMYDTTRIQEVINLDGFIALLEGLLSDMGFVGSEIGSLSKYEIMHLLVAFSFTQKDNVTTMLDLGVRYFDFRPGYGYGLLNNGLLYHQHGFVPGISYATFLTDVLTWLVRNPSEIVVLNLNHQGFLSHEMRPSNALLESYYNDAVSHAASGAGQIQPGEKDDLQRTYSELLSTNTRLIFLNQLGNNSEDASKYDSYSDAYETANVAKVIDELDKMSPAKQSEYDYTVLQLQGTVSATGGGVMSTISTSSTATSPLMATKAEFDRSTYEWVRANTPEFSNQQTLVCLNDFVDNALADIAKDLSRQRLED